MKHTMKSTLIMAVFMAFTFMGCQPKVQDLNVKNENWSRHKSRQFKLLN